MDLAYAPPAARRAPTAPGSRYTAVLGACLLGYALLGKAFAYVGVPPLFIGEVLLVVGLVVAASTGRVGEALASGPLRVWGVLLVWTLARTLPYLGRDGLDAPRDAMLVGYGAFAVVVASLVLADPERLVGWVRQYRRFVVVMLALAWAVYLVTRLYEGALPELPWAPTVKVPTAKGGDLMVHMAAIVAFLMVGLMRSTPLLLVAAAFSSGIIMISNRGGMLAFMLGLGLAWLMRPQGTGAGKVVYAFVFLVAVGAVVGPMVQLQVQGGDRDLSVEQVVENVKSVFVRSGSDALDGTKRWRLLWWSEIADYTLAGPYFWTGKGFGVNLAESDGFVVEEGDGLRSPHNGHLTVLARAGVPGLALWLLLHGAWFASVVGAWRRARRARQRRWVAVFAWLACVWLACLVNASFDVFLEGPMGGVWLWTVVGVGVAAVRLQATHPDLLDPLDLPLPDSDAAARPHRPGVLVGLKPRCSAPTPTDR